MDYEKLYKELLEEQKKSNERIKELENIEIKQKETNELLEKSKLELDSKKIELYDLYKERSAWTEKIEKIDPLKDNEDSEETEVDSETILKEMLN